MLLRITVTSTNPAAAPLGESTFDSFPVVVGRAPHCDLTLPDENKYVSSRHAEIIATGNSLSITDTSANGTFVNDSAAPIGRGNQTQLNDGDSLVMGEFILQVAIQASTQAPAADFNDPFAELSAGKSTEARTAKSPAVKADDPFAGLADSAVTGVQHKTDDHIDRLENIGIGPSAWEPNQVDDPFKFDNDLPPHQPQNAPQQTAQEEDDWAGWVGSLPSNPEPMVPTAPQKNTPSAPSATPVNNNAADPALAALLQAAGLNPAEFAALDQAALGAHIGRILNKSTLSMMLLLRSRDEIKHAMRADVTLLGARGNNPLQFSVTPEDALRRLLTPSAASGFDDANKALEKGLNDIKIHQLAMLEAMRAALQIALSHFDPAVIEERVKDNNPLAANLPLAREAKLWEQFQNRYNEIKREAVDDFSDLFGRELRKAYEKSVEDYKRHD